MGVARTVLLVTDDEDLGGDLRRVLAGAGYEVRVVADGLSAEAELAARLPDLVVVEMLLPGRSGFALAGRAKDLSGGAARVVMLAADPPAAQRDFAYAAGADVVLAKPPYADALLDALAHPRPRPTARIGPAAPARLAPAR